MPGGWRPWPYPRGGRTCRSEATWFRPRRSGCRLADGRSRARPRSAGRPIVGGREVALYRHRLPQLDGTPFLTDGGLETSLVFLDGVDLPAFAAFPLLAAEEGRRRLRRYFEPYLRLAAGRGTG